MKKLAVIMLMVIMLFSLAACHEHEWEEATCTEPKTCTSCGDTEGEPLGHDWKDATCVNPKTCSRCGTTEGEALGHDWKDATCTEPKTCSRCGEKDGDALGHDVNDWKVTKEATCTEKGKKEGTCSRCNQTVEKDIDKIDHTPGDWEVTEKPTKDSKGTRVKKCTVCGAELKSEKFSLSDEELKQMYIDGCESISYDSLARSPGDYEGRQIKVAGYVVQVCSEASSAMYYSTYRVATSGRYDNVVYVKIDNYGSGKRILEDDYITVYGKYDGIYTYETVMGASVSIPSVTAEYTD